MTNPGREGTATTGGPPGRGTKARATMGWPWHDPRWRQRRCGGASQAGGYDSGNVVGLRCEVELCEEVRGLGHTRALVRWGTRRQQGAKGVTRRWSTGVGQQRWSGVVRVMVEVKRLSGECFTGSRQ